MIELVICPLCGGVIHRHLRTQELTKIRRRRGQDTGDVARMLHQIAERDHARDRARARDVCHAHYLVKHRYRYRLWRRYGWAWLMRWPRRQPPALVESEFFEPLEFLER